MPRSIKPRRMFFQSSRFSRPKRRRLDRMTIRTPAWKTQSVSGQLDTMRRRGRRGALRKVIHVNSQHVKVYPARFGAPKG